MSGLPAKNDHGVSRDTQLLAFELELYKSLLEEIDTARALTCAILLRYGEYETLVNLTVNPNDYDDPGLFSDDYLVTSVMQKNPRLPLPFNRKDVAMEKFYSAEARCQVTNAFIQELKKAPHAVATEDLHLLIRIRDIIQRILGPYPTHSDLSYCEENMRFGPGATTSLSGVVTQGAKYAPRAVDCTKELVDFRAFCFPHLWKQSVHTLNIVRGSRLTTVPKNAKTDRVICIEPDLNIFVQLGIGALLRKKLRLFGLDLTTQQTNQDLASKAWIEGLATVDLSAASDNIAYEVVDYLLPPAWVDLLELARSPSVEIEGKWVDLQKWSSMGNGYTFELETLIFFATALAVTSKPEDTVAYGDDIILPQNDFPKLKRALDLLGFKVNDEKTFGKGVFHESCGTDWFKGVNVRPFFLRSDFHDFPSICYLYANNVRRWAHRRNSGGSCDSRCLPFWLRCFTAVDPKYRYRIPEGFGDVGFITDLNRARPFIDIAADGWEGFSFKYRYVASVERRISEEGSYLAFLNGSISDFKHGFESLRGRFRRPAEAIGIHNWNTNLGPWQ